MNKTLIIRRLVLAENVKAIREMRKLSQEQLAKKLKIGRASLANIETGRQEIRTIHVPDFCKALNITPNKLFKGVL